MSLFRAIIADPPWPYESPRALVGNGGRGSEGASRIIQADLGQHYDTMTIEDIRSLIIPATKDALMFMWVTNPFLADGSGVEVVRAWGFEPKTILTWAKVQADGKTPSMKTGHWFRSASEHAIFAVKGKVRRPENFPAIATWQPHGRLPHSVKPDYLHRYAELATPDGPWLEMFARQTRLGWQSWGKQVPATIQIETRLKTAD